MTPKQVNDIFNKLPPKRQKVLVGFLAGHSPEKIMIDADVPSGDALTGHLKELYKNFQIVSIWNDADDRRSGKRKLPLLISLFARCKPELISAQIPDVFDNVEQKEAIAKLQQKSEQPDASSIEERIFQATNQLDPERPMFSRMSAIQALGEIAKDYSRYQWNIMEILAAFIRANAPRKEEGEEERSLKLPEDIQAALTVIGGRDSNKDPEKSRLILRNTDLRGANLSAAQLQGADFCKAKLQGAYLIKANLKEAELVMANLEGAYIHQANLEGAKFLEAILRRTKLSEANLKEADFCNADLGFADLTKANLECAKFDCAKLNGVQLSQANLREAYLIGADLKGTNFSETNIELKQIEYAFGDSTSVLPNDLARPAHWI